MTDVRRATRAVLVDGILNRDLIRIEILRHPCAVGKLDDSDASESRTEMKLSDNALCKMLDLIREAPHAATLVKYQDQLGLDATNRDWSERRR